VPIDHSLSAERTVTRDELRDQAEPLLAERPFYGRLAARPGDRGTLMDANGSIALPKPIAFRVTVARDCRAAVFEHSLQASLIALHLGMRRNLAAAELRALAAAPCCMTSACCTSIPRSCRLTTGSLPPSGGSSMRTRSLAR
ncbi:MAG TPA: hypothetical protein PK752_23990, partial [Accumulibacter sp.]|nr:hypothetical protein [Accumulibacter sp.]